MADKRVAVTLRDPQNKRYRAYCVYDENGDLAGWMLGDAVDAEIVSDWLKENAAEEKARRLDSAEDLLIIEGKLEQEHSYKLGGKEKVVVPTDPEIVVLTEPVPVKKVKARKKSEIADFPVPELEDLIPEELDGD